MQEFLIYKKNILQRAKKLTWKREVKMWDWDAYIDTRPQQKISPAEFSQNITTFEGALGLVKIYSFAEGSQAIQKKCLSMLAHQSRLEKSVMMQQGYARSHLIIEVKAGAAVKLAFDNPIFSYWGTIFFIIGAGATVHISDTHHTKDGLFGAGSILVSVGKNARVLYNTMLADKSSYQSHYAFFLAAHTTVDTQTSGTVEATQLHTQYIAHTGIHTASTATWFVDSQKNGRLYSSIVNEHVAKHTTADVVVKAVGREGVQLMFDGCIDIGKKALDTNSYLQQDVLLLSEKANVRAVPNLEILNNDVRASHGATLGMVDEGQMKYLQSRGLSSAKAEKMLVDGFLNVGKLKTKLIL